MAISTTFTTNTTLGPITIAEGNIGFIFIGSDAASTFGGGTVKIQKVSDSGVVSTLKSVTSLDDPDDAAITATVPSGTVLQVSMTGSSGASLYVELSSGTRLS